MQLKDTDIDRFWSKVDKSGPIPAHCPEIGACWVWTAARNGSPNHQYGAIRIHGGRKTVHTHRMSWQIANGPIPAGMYVCHKCDNPACCNPSHLFLGDQGANMRDCASKGRCGGDGGAFWKAKTHCPQGHPYSGDNLRVNPKTGHRYCRECRRRNERDRYRASARYRGGGWV